MIKKYSRRKFIKVTSAVAAGGIITETLGHSKPVEKTSDSTANIKIGTQLYCVRKACAEDFAGTLKKVAEAGFEGVEFADYFGYSASEIRQMLDEANLQVCGTHIYKETLLGDQLKETIAFNKTLANKNLIVRSFPEESRREKDAWLQFAEQLNVIAEKIKPEGMRVGYHNHEYEFEPLDTGELPWDILADNTSSDVILQLDTGNSAIAGADPISFVSRNPGRTITSHIKPYSKITETAFIGEDDIDWKEAIKMYEKNSGIEWYIIEYEHELKNTTPLDSLKTNMENLKKLIG